MLLLIDAGSQHAPTPGTHSQQDKPSATAPSTSSRSSEQPIAGPSTVPIEASASTLEGDEKDETEGFAPSNDLQLGDYIDWDEVDKEVNEFLNETDDEDVEEWQSDGSIRRLVSTAF